MFRVEGLPIQAITMSPSMFAGLEMLASAPSQDQSVEIGNLEPPLLGQTSVLSAMQELQQLLETGLISDEEFQTKRQQILERL